MCISATPPETAAPVEAAWRQIAIAPNRSTDTNAVRFRLLAIVATLALVFAAIPPGIAGLDATAAVPGGVTEPTAELAITETCGDADLVENASDGAGKIARDLDGDEKVCLVLDGSGSQSTTDACDGNHKYFWHRDDQDDGRSEDEKVKRTVNLTKENTVKWGLKFEDACGSDWADNVTVDYEVNRPPSAAFDVNVTEDSDGDGLGGIELASNASDDGSVTNRSWTVVDGAGDVCAEGQGTTLAAECPTGNWTAQLTVTDEAGASDQASATADPTTDVPVVPSNTAPASPTFEEVVCSDRQETDDGFRCSGEAPVAVDFVNASGTDEETTHVCSWNVLDRAPTDCQRSNASLADELRCDWLFGDGNGTQVPCTDNATHAYAEAGTYDATLQIRDEAGATSDRAAGETLEIVEGPTPRFNVTVLEDADGDGRGNLSLEANASDDGSIASHNWTIEAGGELCEEIEGETFEVACPTGEWTVTLNVTDDENASTVASVSSADVDDVPAIPGNTPPGEAAIDAVECPNKEEDGGTITCSGSLPVSVEVNGSASDTRTDHACAWNATERAPTDCQAQTEATGDQLDCTWTYGDDGTDEIACSSTAQHEYERDGTYDVGLTVFDEGGAASGEVVQTIEVVGTDLPPHPEDLPMELVAEAFDGSDGAGGFVANGPQASNSGWTMDGDGDGIAHVSAACMGEEGSAGMYGSTATNEERVPDASLQFNGKVVAQHHLVGERVEPPAASHLYEPLLVPQPASETTGSRCTYEDTDGRGEAVLTVPAADLTYEEADWSNLTISFHHWGELEPNTHNEPDLDEATVDVRPASASEWSRLANWTQVPEDRTPETIDVNRTALGAIGKALELRFAFQADGDFNDYEGWFVDDVSVAGSDVCPTAREDVPEVVATDTDDVQVVTLDAQPSYDRVGSIVGYEWYNASGGLVGEGETEDVSLERGEHELTLEVTDDQGCTDAETFTVAVTTPPVAEATADETTKQDHDADGSEVFELNGSESYDPDGSGVICEWADEDGNVVGDQCVTDAQVDVGDETFTLTVMDDPGAENTTTVDVEVIPNSPPSADAGEDATVRDANRSGYTFATLDGANSTDTDPGEIESYEWTDRDGNVVGEGAEVTVNVSSAPDPGEEHAFELEVTDDGGATSTDVVNVTAVENELPTANPEATCDRLTCNFTANADDDTRVESCEWAFPSANVTGCQLQRDFPHPGTYEVNLTVNDEEDQSIEENMTLELEGEFLDSFEDGALDNWTRADLEGGENLWRAAEDCQTDNDNRDGDDALQFNLASDCTYDAGRVSGAVDRVVDLTNASEANVTFRHYFEVESCTGSHYDEMSLNVSTDGGSTWERVASWDCRAGTSDGWVAVDRSLDPWAGQKIVLRFAFDSKDNLSNDHRGWLVDRVSVW